MQSLDPPEAHVLGWLAKRGRAMLVLIAEFVNIESGSYDKPGVDAVGTALWRVPEGGATMIATDSSRERAEFA
jgi:glutamate carboxypeptidase